jgi:hypothetical protein
LKRIKHDGQTTVARLNILAGKTFFFSLGAVLS